MATNTFRAIIASLVTTIEGLALTYPASTAETLKEIEGNLPEDREPRVTRHRRFRFVMQNNGTGPRLTSGERDLLRRVSLVVRYDADLDLITAEKTMSYDEELLIVQLEKEANRPSGVNAIFWHGTSFDRSNPMRPTMTMEFEINHALATT